MAAVIILQAGHCHRKTGVVGTRAANGERKQDGTFAPRRVVSDAEVMEVRRRSAEGETQASISADLGIPQPSVSQMVRGVGRYRSYEAVVPPPRPKPAPPPPKPRPSLHDRLWGRLDVGHPLGCWEWTGGKSSAGYGYISAYGRKQPVHRVVYEELVGPIPDGLSLDHLCRNRACANPDHLEPVTPKENVRRGLRCKEGLMRP